MHPERRLMSHVVAEKEKIRIGLSMYSSALRHIGMATNKQIQKLWNTEYGPCLPLGFLLLSAVLISTSNQPLEEEFVPQPIIEQVEECNHDFPAGRQICATPEEVMSAFHGSE